MAGCIKMPLGMKVRLGANDFVLNGNQAPPPEKMGRSYPNFGPCLLWPTAGRIKMALGIEVGFGPGHIVLDGDPVPSLKRGQSAPIFGPFPSWPNGCMYQDAT